MKKGPKIRLIGYHCNVPWATPIIPIHMSTNAETLVKYGPVLAKIVGKICRFLPSRPESYSNSRRNLWS